MRYALRFLRALGGDLGEVVLFADYLLVALAHGAQRLDDRLGDRRLELAVALVCELRFDLLKAQARAGGVDRHQVVDAVLALGVADAGLGVGDGALEFAHNIVGLVENCDPRIRVLVGFRHLARRVLQAHDLSADLRNVRLGHGEGGGVELVEALRNVAGKLQMLLLILPDRHEVGLIKQNVARHQGRVGEQTRVDIVSVFLRFVLELGHARQLAELGVAVEQPRDL